MLFKIFAELLNYVAVFTNKKELPNRFTPFAFLNQKNFDMKSSFCLRRYLGIYTENRFLSEKI